MTGSPCRVGDLLFVDVGLTHTRTARWDGRDIRDVRFPGIQGDGASAMGVGRLAACLAAQEPIYARSFLAGCFGTSGSAIAVVDRVALASAIAQGARIGDVFCRTVVAESLERLGEGLHTVILVAAPDAIVLTGEFAHAAGPWYRHMLVQALSRRFTSARTAAELDTMVRWGEPDALDELFGLAPWLAGTVPPWSS